MDSKKLPLWLVFENAEQGSDPITVIFKVGDDLRQDILTLQIFRLMDKIWKMEGYDLKMNCYGCVSCGDEVGMIEVVLNAATIAGVSKEFGGATASLKEEVLANWLINHNPTLLEQQIAMENFKSSCAAYCVATYVL